MTRDYQDIPDEDLVKDCALEHGIEFEKLNDCSSADDGSAIEMLRDSVTRSKDVCRSLQLHFPASRVLLTLKRRVLLRVARSD
jgi:hypothetical protein